MLTLLPDVYADFNSPVNSCPGHKESLKIYEAGL